MKTIQITVTYFNKGKMFTNSFETKSKDPQSLFNNAIADANVWAQLHGGQVAITRKIDSLHINYLEVNQYNSVERFYSLLS